MMISLGGDSRVHLSRRCPCRRSKSLTETQPVGLERLARLIANAYVYIVSV